MARLATQPQLETEQQSPTTIYQIDGGTVRLNLHRGQTRVWNSKRRFVFMLAGTQSGKTSFGPWWLWREIQRRGPGDYLAVTSTYDLFKLKMLPEMITVFTNILGIGKYWGSAGVIEIANPATREFEANRAIDPMWGRIILRSATSEAGLESATAKGAWLDEVGQQGFGFGAWEAVLRRLSLNMGRVLGTTTLYTVGWLKQQVYDPWIAGDPDYAVIQYASTLNPAFPQQEYERAKRSLPLWKFNMFYRGEFTRPPGMIYSAYEEEVNMVEPFPIPPHWPRYVGIDPGGVNLAMIWIVEDPSTKAYYVYRERHLGGQTTEEYAALLLDDAQGENLAMVVGGTGSEGQVRRDFIAAGVNMMEPAFYAVEPGIDRVISLFKQKRLYVFSSLAGLRDELGTYSRELDADGEITERIRNKNKYHHLDALRYIVTRLKEAVTWDDLDDGPSDQPPNPFRPLTDAQPPSVDDWWAH